MTHAFRTVPIYVLLIKRNTHKEIETVFLAYFVNGIARPVYGNFEVLFLSFAVRECVRQKLARFHVYFVILVEPPYFYSTVKALRKRYSVTVQFENSTVEILALNVKISVLALYIR